MANDADPVQSVKTLKYKGAVMKVWVRRAMGGLVAVMIAGYATICYYMYSRQDALIYPGGTIEIEPLPAPPAPFEAVTIDTPDGEHLKGWWHPPEPGHGVVLYLQGNRENIAVDWRLTRLRDLTDAGYGVLGLEYRGFGGSTGHPNEPGLIADAEAGYGFIAQHAPDTRIALFADSLGTGVAVALAARRPVAGLVLDSPYASATRLAHLSYPWLPTSLLLRDRWDSEGRVTAIHAPVFIAHCDADRRIPLSEGKRLFDTADQPKEMIVLPGCGHVQTWIEPVRTKVLNDFAAWIGPTR